MLLKYYTKLERILLAPYKISNSDTCSIFTSSQPKTLNCITIYECSFIQTSAVHTIITKTQNLKEIVLTGTHSKIDKFEVKKYCSASKEVRTIPKMSFK
jgi:hypothetical protein